MIRTKISAVAIKSRFPPRTFIPLGSNGVSSSSSLGATSLVGQNIFSSFQSDNKYYHSSDVSFSNQKRFLSTASTTVGDNSDPNVVAISPAPTPPPQDFEATMNKLFDESSQQQQLPATSEGDQWFVDQALAQEPWDPKWWNLADQAINSVNFLHDVTGIGYAGSIVAATCIVRLCILPLAIRGQRAASRMAHLQPELQMMKQRYEALGTPTQAETRAFTEQMQSLFKRYDVKPFSSIAVPFVQAPIFIGMFFGMRKMPELFPEQLSTGGLFWFTDLTIPDPTYILPLACGISFFATIEAGKDQMLDSNPDYGPAIVNAFRAMSLVMVPVITTFPSAMLCYWVPNNFITLIQSVALRNDFVKKQLGIWDRPKPIPGQAKDKGFAETMENLVKQVRGEPTTDKEKMKRRNQEIETKKRMQQVSKAARARRRASP
ncbi:60Kd inner membrane domain containing protein [Nitzschia inconspicua]|uniref:60Kd inner membrane domain containing protein n=1 Tax=Nitzschia inconspicua TaxID=303405 RepID=A0A9K3LK86_9STRA|nr:60Kd inner membrane domain containing protein [Nitzschia inconspicua]